MRGWSWYRCAMRSDEPVTPAYVEMEASPALRTAATTMRSTAVEEEYVPLKAPAAMGGR